MLKQKGSWLEILEHQVSFSSAIFNEVKGTWQHFGDEVRFDFIVENALLLQNMSFNRKKISLLKELAIKLWKSCEIDAIQSCVVDTCCNNLESINSGTDIIAEPFAIVPSFVFKKFAPEYFRNYLIIKAYVVVISNNLC
jgi:hypothetical protein